MHSLSFLGRRSKPFIFAACCYIFLSKSKDAAQHILLFAPQVRRNKRKLDGILSCGSGIRSSNKMGIGHAWCFLLGICPDS